MTNDAVVIVGIGMTTAVGLSSAETAASVRAGMARFTETTMLDRFMQPLTLAEVPEDALPPLSERLRELPGPTARERRMLRLAARPLRECLAPLGARASRLGLCLALPEMESPKPLDRPGFLHRLAFEAGGAIEPSASDASHAGRAGGVIAIGQAVLTIRQGTADFMVAGGVDSYRDLHVLATLDQEQRLKSAVNLDGFIPGEGAAFLLLASRRAAGAAGLRALAQVAPMAMGFEAGHLYSEEPYRGDGLAATFQQLVAQSGLDTPIGDVYSSMTGESHWAKEWGVAHMRSRAAFRDDVAIHHPADSYGDAGAACGPLLVGLAALATQARHRGSPALAYGSSDRGARAAVLIT